jgi:hypothetical protein
MRRETNRNRYRCRACNLTRQGRRIYDLRHT